MCSRIILPPQSLQRRLSWARFDALHERRANLVIISRLMVRIAIVRHPRQSSARVRHARAQSSCAHNSCSGVEQITCDAARLVRSEIVSHRQHKIARCQMTPCQEPGRCSLHDSDISCDWSRWICQPRTARHVIFLVIDPSRRKGHRFS